MTLLRRFGFGGLGVLNAVWGIWAVGAPAHFFNTFPGLGWRWTGAYPPYNEHLVSDLGATLLLIGVLLIGVAIVDRRAATWVVTAGVTLFNALHLVFHLVHRGSLDPTDYWLSIAALAAGVLVPPALALTHRSP
jgi:hypothetical protein